MTSQKSKMAWMPMYFADWIADTMHLSVAQHGAYFLLVSNYWISRKALKNDDKYLASITRCSAEQWAEMRPTLEEFFTIEENTWVHGRIESELAKAALKYEQAVANGRAGGRAKAKAANVQSNPEPHIVAVAKQTLQHPLSKRSSKKLANYNHNYNHKDKERDIPALFSFCQDFFKQNNLPVPTKLTDNRKKRLISITRNVSDEEFKTVIQKISQSSFLLGKNNRDFVASFDFIIKPDTFQKLSENNYATKKESMSAESSDPWDQRMAMWKNGIWNHRENSATDWGPPPDQAKTCVPEKYLVKHGLVRGN
tara:strand:+ start:1114 stop:2043 length:930 start_codon:yes stop_codon:yes gene_type:complete